MNKVMKVVEAKKLWDYTQINTTLRANRILLDLNSDIYKITFHE